MRESKSIVMTKWLGVNALQECPLHKRILNIIKIVNMMTIGMI